MSEELIEDTDSDATTCDPTWCTTELADDEAHDVGLGLSQPRDTSTGLLDMKRDVKKSDFGSNVQCSRFPERPKFPYPAACKKVPFVLSSAEVLPPVEVPASINQYLRAYQREGAQFLYSQFKNNRGSVLCDESGLGKRVQVIAFLCAVLGRAGPKDKASSSRRPTSYAGAALVVCPASVIDHWVNEVESWSYLSHATYTGANGKVTSDADTLERARKKALDVVLIACETAVTHLDDLNSVDWLAVVCDDLISGGSDVCMATLLSPLRVKRRIGLFDPAVQIQFSDLWCLLSWVAPNGLGSLQSFQSSFEQPILKSQNHIEKESTTGYAKLAELEQMVESFVLGRTHAKLCSQLPKREDYTLLCPISELQESIYQSIVECDDAQLVLRSGEACDCYSGNDRGECCYVRNGEGISWKSLLPEYMTLLTKCANHLGLLLPPTSSNSKHKGKTTRICCEIFSKHPQFLATTSDASFLTLSDPQYCGKMQAFEKLLLKFKREHAKVVLFCHSVQLLNVLEDFLVCKGYMYCRLDGSSCKARDTLKAFNSDLDQFAILISRKCEGMVLNITGANRVIIFDPNYNLSTEVQAEERLFKLGQSRDVIVYRLLAEGTIEEALYIRENHKEVMQHNGPECDKDQRYFISSLGSEKKTSDYASIFCFRKSNIGATVDRLSEIKKTSIIEGCVIKLFTEHMIGIKTFTEAHTPFRGSSDFVSCCVKIALGPNHIDTEGHSSNMCKLKEHSMQHIKDTNHSSDLGYCSAGSREMSVLPLQAACELDSEKCALAGNAVAVARTEAARSAALTGTERKSLSIDASCLGQLLISDHSRLSNPDHLVQEGTSGNTKSLSRSTQARKQGLRDSAEEMQLPITGGTLNAASQSGAHSPAASSPILGPLPPGAHSPEPVEALYDGATVCDGLSPQGTVSTFLPSPRSSLSQGSLVALDLTPSPGILRPRLDGQPPFAPQPFKKSPAEGLYDDGATVIDELFEGSEVTQSSPVNTAAEFSEEPPSSKRKFDGSYKVEGSADCLIAVTSISDIDALFEL